VLSFADLSVKVPQPSADEVAETSSSSVESDTDFWVDLMQTATRYGWVFLVVIAFGVLLYG